MARSAQSKSHAEFARECPHHARRHAEQAHALVLPMEKNPVLFFSELLHSSTRPDVPPEATFLAEGQGTASEAPTPHRPVTPRGPPRRTPGTWLGLRRA